VEPNRLRDESPANVSGVDQQLTKPADGEPEAPRGLAKKLLRLVWNPAWRRKYPPGLWYPGTRFYPRYWPRRDASASPSRVGGDSRSSSVSQPEAPRVVGANPQRHRDALIGGLILAVLGVAVAGFGIWAFVLAEDLKADPTNAERSGLGYVFGWLFLGLGVIFVMLGAWAARGGPIARKLAGIVGAGCGGLIILSGLPLLAGAVLLAAPFFVSAYLLLRSPGRPTRRG
jgi:hypothetical protein